MRRILLALALLAACGGDKSTNPNTDAVDGVYSLRTINGNPLPFAIQSGANTLTVTSDVITLGSNGSWTESAAYTQTVSGQTTTGSFADGGTWTRAGNVVILNSPATGGYSGTYSNGSYTVTSNGFLEVFTR